MKNNEEPLAPSSLVIYNHRGPGRPYWRFENCTNAQPHTYIHTQSHTFIWVSLPPSLLCIISLPPSLPPSLLCIIFDLLLNCRIGTDPPIPECALSVSTSQEYPLWGHLEPCQISQSWGGEGLKYLCHGK